MNWRQILERFAPAIALLVLVVITAIANPAFLKPENLLNIGNNWSYVGIIAIGMTVVIIAGGIDLSVGSLLAWAGGMGVLTLNACHTAGWSDGAGLALAALVIILCGLLGGLINAGLVVWGRLPPFIATLGGLAAWRSLALAGADGGEYRVVGNQLFQALGNGGIPIPGTNVAPRAPEPIPLLIPWSILLVIVVAVIAWLLLNRLRAGRYIYAVGCNEQAARYAAVPVGKTVATCYILLGLCTGLAALFLASRMNAVSSGATGLLYELDAIAAVVIGGTRMSGGAGRIGGTIIGVLLLGVIQNMLNLLDVSPYLQGLVKGLIIITAVLIQRPRNSTD